MASPDRVEVLEHEVEQLHQALETRRTIGVAIGILMERHGISDEAGFQMLVSASQVTHRKLRDIATELMSQSAKNLSPVPHRLTPGQRREGP